MTLVLARRGWVRRAITLGCISAACTAALPATATATGDAGATVTRTWLYVEFAGRGQGIAQNATPSGGTLRMSASWTFLYRLPVLAFGTSLSPQCRNISCAGHAFPYAARGSGRGSITGAGDASLDCSARIGASRRYIGPATAISWHVSRRALRVFTYSPMESGLALADQRDLCPVFGGEFAERTGTAGSAAELITALERHRGTVFSTAVGRASSLPADGTERTPQHVWWTGRVKIKLGGCVPTLRNVRTCFARPSRHRRARRAPAA